MKKVFPLVALCLVACAPDETALQPADTGERSSIPLIAESRELETVPSQFSLAHFSNMLLSGTGLTLEKVLAENSAYTRYSIFYRSNNTKVSGIMNIPKGAGPFPLLILNHGYIDPKIYTQGRGLKREQDYLAREGFAVLHTDYRGHGPSDPNPDPTDIADGAIGYSMDSANAILAVRAAKLPTVDVTKVGMFGHSMGGGVTMNIATSRPDLIDAVVLYAPVNGDAWQNFLRWRADSEEAARETLAALGPREENESGWDAISYVTRLQNVDDPVLLFHGTKDKDVPLGWSDGLDSGLRAAGKEVEYVVYQGEGHEFGPYWNDFMAKTAAFFQRELSQ